MITIGRILKPQGIKGELKILPLSSDISRFEKLSSVFVGAGAVPYAVKSTRITGDFVFITLKGVDDRNQAEALRGQDLRLERKNAVLLKSGYYFISDMIDVEIFDFLSGALIGRITNVDQFGAADVVTVSTLKGTMRFPFLKALDLKINIEKKTATINSEKLAEVEVYED